MSDEYILNKYLSDYEVAIKGSHIGVLDKITSKVYFRREFEAEFRKIFGHFNISERYTSLNFLDDWYMRNKLELVGTLKSFLSNCYVVLRQRDWIVKRNTGEIVDINLFYSLFEDEYNKMFLVTFFDEWISERACEATEKAMGIYNGRVD